MDFVLNGIELPVRISPAVPMNDDELMRFCAANELLRVEREPNGEILVMTPAGGRTSSMNIRISRLLDEWAEEDGGASPSTRAQGSHFRTAPCAIRTVHGFSLRDGIGSRKKIRTVSLP